MPSISDCPARGKVIRVEDLAVVFAPSNTNYQLKLATAARYDGPVGSTVSGTIRVVARKLWTVPNGGNFIAPISGPTRIVQGRILFVDETMLVVQAGVPVQVQLPTAPDSIDLNSGNLIVGGRVNVTCLPGAAFEWLRAGAALSATAA